MIPTIKEKMDSQANPALNEIDFSDIYKKNRNFSFLLIGGLGTLVFGLVFFKLLMVDFVAYEHSLIKPLLIFTSAVATCLCINGWLLSVWGKILLSILSLSYPIFPVICRIFELDLIKNEIVQIDTFLNGDLNLTMVALCATVVYSIIFQSYQVYFSMLLKRKPKLVIQWLDTAVIPSEKACAGNFDALNRSFKLRKLLSDRSRRASNESLVLFRDKLKSFSRTSLFASNEVGAFD